MEYSFVQIGGDPTAWQLVAPMNDASGLTSGEPVQVAIGPPAGTLVLSGRAAGSVVLSVMPIGNAIPSGLTFGSGPDGPGDVATPSAPYLYVPSVTGLTQGNLGFPLPAGTGLGDVTQQIMTAMSQGTLCNVQTNDGIVVLNGATLPFVVLFEATQGN